MSDSAEAVTPGRGLRERIGLWLGPALAALVLLIGPPEALRDTYVGGGPAWWTLALLLLMATWWVTEAIPIPVTSLIPLVWLPLAGVLPMGEAASPYMSPIVVLLMGGFLFAKAIERWGLHARIALHVVARSGDHPAALVLGFMVAAAGLSMWISNTATAIMMMPIALSVAAATLGRRDPGGHPFTIALLLGIAWACSIGGLGTPVGTPTNLIVLGYLNTTAGMDIGFLRWMAVGLPAVLVLVPLGWFVLTRWAFRLPKHLSGEGGAAVDEALKELGPTTTPEWRTLTVFAVIASLWVFRGPLNDLVVPGLGRPLAGLGDSSIAILAVILVFLVPAGGEQGKGQALLDWPTAERIPWGVVLLFGGGLSLANAITASGLSTYLGQSLSGLSVLPLVLLVLLVTSAVLALTEVTSNVATASALMPILGAVALEIGVPLSILAIPVALAASCAFMLPMATGPNAVVYATGHVSVPTMTRAGFRLNLLAIPIIAAIALLIAPNVLGSTAAQEVERQDRYLPEGR